MENVFTIQGIITYPESCGSFEPNLELVLQSSPFNNRGENGQEVHAQIDEKCILPIDSIVGLSLADLEPFPVWQEGRFLFFVMGNMASFFKPNPSNKMDRVYVKTVNTYATYLYAIDKKMHDRDELIEDIIDLHFYRQTTNLSPSNQLKAIAYHKKYKVPSNE